MPEAESITEGTPPPPQAIDLQLLPPPPGHPLDPLGPARPPRQPDARPWRLAGLVALAGVAADLGLRGGVPNLALAVSCWSVAAAMLTDGRVRTPMARLAVALSALPAGLLALRTSSWLTAANVSAVAGLLALAVAYSNDPALLRATPSAIARRLVRAVPGGWSAPRLLAPVMPRTSDRASRRMRRAAIAGLASFPVLATVALLLASADPVFAGLLTPDLAIGPLVGHVLLAGVISLLALAIVGAASAAPDPEGRREPEPGRVGALEVVTVLGLTALLLGTFVIAQLVALTDAGRRLVTDAGLTPADYARSGFFQLCWATGLLLGLLAVVRRVADPAALRAPAIRALATAVPLLTLGLVAVAARRMALYDQAFGLTMLRLSVLAATMWMGATLLAVAARNARGEGTWPTAAAVGTALVLVVGANVADPEAFVVRHNTARAAAGAELDARYLDELSSDAVPALLAAADATDDPALAAQLRGAAGCDSRHSGVEHLNLAARRADDARDRSCPSP